jgi:hypothetical protein
MWSALVLVGDLRDGSVEVDQVVREVRFRTKVVGERVLEWIGSLGEGLGHDARTGAMNPNTGIERFATPTCRSARAVASPD